MKMVIQWKVRFIIYLFIYIICYFVYLNTFIKCLDSMTHLELSDTDSDSDVLLDVRKAKMNQNSLSNKFLNASRYKKNKRIIAWTIQIKNYL